MILEDDCVKVVDFGLARVATNEGATITGTGRMVGSVHYMSPEQCRGGNVDARSDLYSLACVLFEAIAGVPPLVADSIIPLLQKHLQDQPPSLAEANPSIEIPAGLEKVLEMALSKDLSARQQSADQFKFHLEFVLDGQGDKIARKLPSRATARPSVRGRLTASLCSLLLLGVLLAAVSQRLSANNVSLNSTPPRWSGKFNQAITAEGPNRALLFEKLLQFVRSSGPRGIPTQQLSTVYLVGSHGYTAKGQLKEAAKILQEGRSVLEKTKDRESLAQVEVEYASVLMSLFQLDAAQKVLKSVLNKQIHLSNSGMIPRAYEKLSSCAESKVDLPRAEKYLSLAAKYYQRCREHAAELECLTRLVLLACALGDNESFDSYRKTLKKFVGDSLEWDDFVRYLNGADRLNKAGFKDQSLAMLDDCNSVALNPSCATHVRHFVQNEALRYEVAIYLNKGMWTRANELCTSALRDRPVPAVRLALAESQVAQGMISEAEQNYRSVVKSGVPQSPGAAYSLALLYERTGRSDEAVPLYKLLTKSQAPSSELRAWFYTGVTRNANNPLRRNQLFQAGIECLRSRHDQLQEAFFKLAYADVLTSSTDLEERLNLLRQVVSCFESSLKDTAPSERKFSAYVSLGNACVAQAKYAEAESWFKKALLQEKDNVTHTAQCWRLLSDVYLRQQKKEDASYAGAKCLELASQDLSGLQCACWAMQYFCAIKDMAAVENILNQFDALIQRLSVHYPLHVDYLCQSEIERAMVLSSKGNIKEALAGIERAIAVSESIERDSTECKLIAAEFHFWLSQTEQFNKLVAALRRQAPLKVDELLGRLAMGEAAKGRINSAKTLMNPIISTLYAEEFPPDVTLRFLYWAAQIFQDDLQVKDKLLAKALEIKQEHPTLTAIPDPAAPRKGEGSSHRR